MKKFIKKHNMGMLTGITILVVLFLYYTFTFMMFNASRDDIESTLLNYCNDISYVITETTEESVNEVLDKYWTDEEDVPFDFGENAKTKNDMQNLAKEGIKNSVFSNFSGAYAYYSSSEFNSINSKTCDVYCSVRYEVDPYEEGRQFFAINGTTPVYETYCSYKIRLKKINNEWKISAITTDNSSIYD